MRAKAPRKPRTRQAVLSTAPEQLYQHADEAIAVLNAMASHDGLLLCELVAGERSVGELAKSLGLAHATVSWHLPLLRGDGVVRGWREAQTIH